MYRALYRKWRPQRFEDVVGQRAIVTALKNQITANRVGHAYLFTGVRGTGKTTCAKIFAKAVNCLHPVNGDPCGECEICKGIDNGSILDVVEMDAASNNGVDDIRDLRDETAYTPSACKYKVYIIDEVHMLSTAAFNALLKTLEEPPAHVIFILATTEIQKVPATILSRCQRYDFTRIGPEAVSYTHLAFFQYRHSHGAHSLHRSGLHDVLRLQCQQSIHIIADGTAYLGGKFFCRSTGAAGHAHQLVVRQQTVLPCVGHNAAQKAAAYNAKFCFHILNSFFCFFQRKQHIPLKYIISKQKMI